MSARNVPPNPGRGAFFLQFHKLGLMTKWVGLIEKNDGLCSEKNKTENYWLFSGTNNKIHNVSFNVKEFVYLLEFYRISFFPSKQWKNKINTFLHVLLPACQQ